MRKTSVYSTVQCIVVESLRGAALDSFGRYSTPSWCSKEVPSRQSQACRLFQSGPQVASGWTLPSLKGSSEVSSHKFNSLLSGTASS